MASVSNPLFPILAALLAIILSIWHFIPRPNKRRASAEAILRCVIASGSLDEVTSAIKEHGASSGKAVLQQAQERREKLSNESHKQSRRAHRKAHKRDERAADVVAAEQQAAAAAAAAAEIASQKLLTHERVQARFVRAVRYLSSYRTFRKVGERTAAARAEAARAEAEARAAEVAAAKAQVAAIKAETAAKAKTRAKPKAPRTAAPKGSAAPKGNWASIAQPKGGDGPALSPAFARLEDATRAALRTGARGVPAFRRAVEGLRLPASMQREMRISIMRVTAESLSGEVEKDTATLEKVLSPLIGVLHSVYLEPQTRVREALFFPNKAAKARLLSLLASARRSLCACIYTITDDEIREQLLALHARGVHVRVISDDEQAIARGSDIFALAKAGIPTVVAEELLRPSGAHRASLHRVDRHMHHKFCIADNALLLTGSYNWTHSAATRNEENILVTSEPHAVAACATAEDPQSKP